MFYKKLILVLVYFFSQLIPALAEEKEPKFTLKNNSDQLSLEFKIPKNHTIYSIYPGETGLPTKVELHKSQNLKDYTLIWPEPLLKISEIEEKIYFYENHLEIPLVLEAIDPTKNIELTFDIEYVLCSNQCELKQELLSAVISSNKSRAGFGYWDKIFSVSFDILWILLLATLGGFVLNFMPCVLPVLSLKIINFVRHPDLDNKKAALFTIAGIITSFWIIAFIAIAFKNAGKYFGFGLNFQEPVFIIALILIITFFISVSLDRVSFKFPNSVSSFFLNSKFRSRYVEYYFSGILATILSTPCTAPFLGSALFLSFQQSNVMIFATFTFVALGFSVPYIFLLICPNTLKHLPKSGKWMNNLKFILVTLLIGTIFWLLLILEAQLGVRAAIGLFFLLILIKFILENNKYILNYWLVKLSTLSILLIFTFLLPKYSNIQDQQHQLKIDHLWQEFDYEKIDSLVKNGKIVFVDITADWCVTCKYNKYFVFSRDRVIKALSNNQIVAMRGDFTNYNPQIHDFLVKRKIQGIPYNVVFSLKSPNGIELPVLLSAKDIEDVIEQAK
jgi:suppressor for copper-sensitivity B